MDAVLVGVRVQLSLERGGDGSPDWLWELRGIENAEPIIDVAGCPTSSLRAVQNVVEPRWVDDSATWAWLSGLDQEGQRHAPAARALHNGRREDFQKTSARGVARRW